MQELINQILHIEALELLSKLDDKSIDMVLCDLPYQVTNKTWDVIIPFEPMWAGLKRVIKPKGAIVLTATEPFASRLRMSNIKDYRYDWVWDKSISGNFLLASVRPMAVHEMVLVFSVEAHNYYPIMRKGELRTKGGGKSNLWALDKSSAHSDSYYPTSIISISNADRDVIHPTQKPVALFEYLIKTYTQEGELVLDMCVGSGTTALACQNLGRRFICGDSSLEYVLAARQRLQNANPFENSVMKTGEIQLSLFKNLPD